MGKRELVAVVSAATLLAMLIVMSPEVAFADSGNVGFVGVIDRLRTIVTVFLLPLGILIAAWKMIYLAVVCGIIGQDPLNELGGGSVDAQSVKTALRNSIWGFFKGLCWVAGMFIVFQFALGIAAFLAQTLTQSFG